MEATGRESGHGWLISRGRTGRYKWYQSQVSHFGSGPKDVLGPVVGGRGVTSGIRARLAISVLARKTYWDLSWGEMRTLRSLRGGEL